MGMDLSNIWLFGYVIAWLITFIIYQRKVKFFGAGSFIMVCLILYAISSYFLFNNSYYNSHYGFKPINLVPFVYLYLMLMLAFKPIGRFEKQGVKSIQRPSNFALYAIIILFIIASVLRLINEIPNFMEGLLRIMIDPTGGADIYNEMRDDYDTKGDGLIVSLPAIISNVLGDIAVLLLFYYMTLPDEKKIVTIGLFMGFISTVISFIAESQRGPVMARALTLLVTYFAMRRFIPPKRNKLISKLLIILVILISIPMAAISISRFSMRDGGGTLGSLTEYSGQANIFFNNYAFDDNGIRYGDRTMPLFKRMLGFENVPKNFVERRAKYPKLYINDEYFIGFVGDFCLDFGPIFAFLIFLVFTGYVLNSTKTSNGTIKFHQLLLLHFVMCIFAQGSMKLYAYSDMGNLNVIALFMAYFYFLLDYNGIQNKRRSKQAKIESK